MKRRIEYIDIVKFVAIFLVLWGHAITQLMPHDLNTNAVYTTIYSFHMPLFMMVSGLFAASSFKLSFAGIVNKKFMQLVWPSLTFGVLWYILVFGVTVPHHTISSAGITADSTSWQCFLFSASGWKELFITNSIAFIKHEAASYWFLKSLFVCYMITWMAHQVAREYKMLWLQHILILIMLGALLYIQRWDVTCFKVGSMLPFFWLGMLIKDYLSFLYKISLPILLVSLICYALCMKIYTPEFSFGTYFFHTISGQSMHHYLIYLATALSGCMLVISASALLTALCGNTKLTKAACIIGSNTLGIYLWQKILLEITMPKFIHIQTSMGWYNWLITPAVSIIFLLLCYFVSQIGRKKEK